MNMMSVPVEHYKELLKADLKLSLLENGGVDNWEGYDFALEGFEQEWERESNALDRARKLIESVR